MSQHVILLGALLISVLFIIVGTTKLKMHPFLVLLLASYGVGFMSGMPAPEIVKVITGGFGNIMAYIGIVIILGTIIGTILEKSGAAIKLAELVIRLVGKKYPALAMGLIGYIVSIPVFCDSAFVILSSLKRSLIRKTGRSAIAMSIALSTGLYATHTLVPPTPGPIAAAGNLGIDNQLGMVILLGLLVAVVAMLVGYWWASYTGKRYQSEEDHLVEEDQVIDERQLPSGWLSVLPIFLPIVLIAIRSIVLLVAENETGILFQTINFLGDPVNALFLGLFSSFLLIKGKSEKITEWVGSGIQASASILIITGAGGAFGAMLKATHIGDSLGALLADYELGIFLPFIIAAALKTAQGSSTVSLVATSALIAPLLPGLGLDSAMGKSLSVLAVGAGAMTISHANDSFFWVVTQFSKMPVSVGYKTHTLATLFQGLAAMLTIYFFSLVLL
ncbi:GntP family permease [Sunxiuqinia elliptica]|uniref:Putative D-glycerate permease n=1 Tax=Sunxiuqinia elliptica TaxID=655355 RepID=A0A4R6H498_9BACT|nr:GntP family permease [Sunxiuqinia elliptica]TDO02724.1 putative D-glycerate permease [Sunxiuqinia elliptica]TDO58538.1 putative D-glycerate permease [Sunxiuqinia elliptica]